MKRESTFFENIMVSKRGIIKIAASQVPGKEAVSKTDVKKVLKTFEKSPDVSKNTINQYKQRAELDINPKQVAQDFFKDLNKARKQKKQMHLTTAMSLRQTGVFKIAGRDVYEDLETGDFWKISDDKKHVIRMFKENDEGISDKRASEEKVSKKALIFNMGEGVVGEIKPTEDEQGFEIKIEGSFRSGNDMTTTIKQIQDLWKKIDID